MTSALRQRLLRELSRRMREVDRGRSAAADRAAVADASLQQQADVQFWVGYYAGLLEAKQLVQERVP